MTKDRYIPGSVEHITTTQNILPAIFFGIFPLVYFLVYFLIGSAYPHHDVVRIRNCPHHNVVRIRNCPHHDVVRIRNYPHHSNIFDNSFFCTIELLEQ